jgi:N-methylhydantoinase B
MITPVTQPDPVTLAVIEAGVTAASDEMFAVLKKTAMSPIISEVLDAGTGITDATGRLLSSGAGIPSFVGVLDKAVTALIARHGDTLADGDMFITNDPTYGGVTHLNDVVIAQPVFADGRCIAWTASIAHWTDIGGMTPGSMSVHATEIWAEGLRLPAVRLFAAGQPVQPVFQIIAANSRQPDFAIGDLWAQIAAARRAGHRLTALHDRYGAKAWDAALAAALEQGQARALKGLAGLPQGRWQISEEQDDGALWSVAITIAPDVMAIDLRDAPPQRPEPMNTSRDGAVIAAQMLFKALTDAGGSANAGSFAPLRVLTTPGTIFHAAGAAPHGYYFETRIRLFDLLWRCLSQAMPDRLPAGSFATIGGLVIAGLHPDTGRRTTLVEPQMGGWGATATRDGQSAMYSTSHGETFTCPAEIAEARYGLTVLSRALADAPGGIGLHQGGRGLTTRYALRAPATLSIGLTRARQPVWGAAGGGPGGTNGMTVARAGVSAAYTMVSGLALAAGDVVTVTTAGGGGWGAALPLG